MGHECNRQTGLLWKYRAVHYSASRGKKIAPETCCLVVIMYIAEMM